ncbi:hypothetical protein [Microbacterium terregens]|uniref:Uncharacterized protein n=1 Tax=Microbacterium terregens TaxID=69363 RepID=A0ABV5SZL3_9MICO
MTIVTLDVIDGDLEATGIVTGVAEDSGTCTLTVSRGGDQRTATAPGAAGPDSTNCGLMKISTDDFASGEWEAIIDYSSDTYRGRSNGQAVTVR